MRNHIEQIIEPAIIASGYEFVGCEWAQEHGRRVLRVYADDEKGITIDACGQLSRQLSSLLEVEYSTDSPYVLEVSSPGVDRPLFTLAHYQRFIGHRVKIKLRQSVKGKSNFCGILQSVDEKQIHLMTDENDLCQFEFENILKGRLRSCTK